MIWGAVGIGSVVLLKNLVSIVVFQQLFPTPLIRQLQSIVTGAIFPAAVQSCITDPFLFLAERITHWTPLANPTLKKILYVSLIAIGTIVSLYIGSILFELVITNFLSVGYSHGAIEFSSYLSNPEVPFSATDELLDNIEMLQKVISDGCELYSTISELHFLFTLAYGFYIHINVFTNGYFDGWNLPNRPNVNPLHI
jgi:hypothetical protein